MLFFLLNVCVFVCEILYGVLLFLLIFLFFQFETLTEPTTVLGSIWSWFVYTVAIKRRLKANVIPGQARRPVFFVHNIVFCTESFLSGSYLLYNIKMFYFWQRFIVRGHTQLDYFLGRKSNPAILSAQKKYIWEQSFFYFVTPVQLIFDQYTQFTCTLCMVDNLEIGYYFKLNYLSA